MGANCRRRAESSQPSRRLAGVIGTPGKEIVWRGKIYTALQLGKPAKGQSVGVLQRHCSGIAAALQRHYSGIAGALFLGSCRLRPQLPTPTHSICVCAIWVGTSCVDREMSPLKTPQNEGSKPQQKIKQRPDFQADYTQIKPQESLHTFFGTLASLGPLAAPKSQKSRPAAWTSASHDHRYHAPRTPKRRPSAPIPEIQALFPTPPPLHTFLHAAERLF